MSRPGRKDPDREVKQILKHKKFGHVHIPFKRIHLELTNVCDFNCSFCPKCVMKRSYGYMDTELAYRTISDIKNLGLAEKITFHVMGEPTLHKDFFKILDHAAKVGMPVGLTTNGGGLGRSVGQRLLEYPLHQVDVSLQTPDARSFVLRKAGGLKFEDYLAGTLNFFGEYHRRHPETIFKFRFLNTRFPQKSIEAKNGPVRVISSTEELRRVFSEWVKGIYQAVGPNAPDLDRALERINKLGVYQWNVVEIMPQVYFETYILSDWGHAFQDGKVLGAWAGYCDGMRDHFAVLHNGNVTLCCIDYEGKTALGNLHDKSLADILSSEKLGKIMNGFKVFRPVHPYCKFCLGSKSRLSWAFKPVLSVIGLHALRPYFYRQVKIYD